MYSQPVLGIDRVYGWRIPPPVHISCNDCSLHKSTHGKNITIYVGESNENLKNAKRIRELTVNFFQEALVKCWRTCIECNRDYVEK
jgi:hypothetical protein